MTQIPRSLRSDLGRVRGLGSAKEGVGHWWTQRVTAVALVPLSIWFVASIVGLAGADYATVVNWIRAPLPALLLVVLVAVTIRHAQLGVQVVIEDYVHHEGAKIGLILVVKAALVLVGLAAILAVLKLAFRG